MAKKNKVENLPLFLFHQGTNFKAYDFLGCHKTDEGKIVFRTWAPNADGISLVSDFTDWEIGVPFERISDAGVWELCLDNDYDSLIGNFYKFKISGSGVTRFKSDPYAFMSQTLGETASIITNADPYKWTDDSWLSYRKTLFESDGTHFYSTPMNIYEMHLGSWKTLDGQSNEDGKHYLNYRVIADELVPYVKHMGYTHVELMPISEHPYDGSWGYQVCGFYAPTSRFGTPDDFRYFVNKLHSAGIGIILDWVPAHFPKDEHGLYEFDGQPLYEYQGKDRMEHKGWGTRCFDVGRTEVQSFLISNALYWFREFHIDGLRTDAVSSMLYLDYDREPGEWNPNIYGDNKNLEAIAFFQKLNTAVFGEFPDVLMIAEESTAWSMVTGKVSDGGLGFNFKWNMGWANDMFSYVSCDPLFRQYEHTKLTFPMMYAFSESFILPVSHDEVVHGKKSLLDKMYGEYEDKFACMRVFLTYMMTLPGKKMLFMGCEFAPFREWDYKNQLEWFMLDFPMHKNMQTFVSDLNNFYLSHKQLWQIDDGWDGFEWIEADQADMNTISYKRKAFDKSELIVVLNFSPVRHSGYPVRVGNKGSYKEIFSTDDSKYSGKGNLNRKVMKAKTYPTDMKKEYYIEIDLPAYGGVIIEKNKKNINKI